MVSRSPEPRSPASGQAELGELDRWLAQPLTGAGRRPADAEALAARVQMILETAPGTLPWLPEYGCDLSDIVGQPATADAISDVGRRISGALSRWLPDVIVLRCEPRLLTEHWARGGAHDRLVPVAESALVPFSLNASLAVELELQTLSGPLSLNARIRP